MIKITEWHKSRKRKRSIRSIRDTMAFFGYNLDDYTDDEIEEAVIEFGKSIAKTGVTAKEASEAFSILAKI